MRRNQRTNEQERRGRRSRRKRGAGGKAGRRRRKHFRKREEEEEGEEEQEEEEEENEENEENEAGRQTVQDWRRRRSIGRRLRDNTYMCHSVSVILSLVQSVLLHTYLWLGSAAVRSP